VIEGLVCLALPKTKTNYRCTANARQIKESLISSAITSNQELKKIKRKGKAILFLKESSKANLMLVQLVAR
jgi:hypothetical protein